MIAAKLRAIAPVPFAFVLIAFAHPALAQVAVIQTQDTNYPGVVAEMTEARRSEGVLNLKIRIRNTGTKDQQVTIYSNTISGDRSRAADAFYVQAESKKYLILSDTEKIPLTVAWDGCCGLKPEIKPGASYTWWAKYPAPPANVRKFNFHWPLGVPFDDVPITDK